jgi:hypothetical protein
MEEQTKQRVRDLLMEAGNAHSVFERTELKGVRDEEWPAWYARYCLDHGLHSIIGREIGEDELAGLLQKCDVDYRQEEPREPWPDYYAERIVESG